MVTGSDFLVATGVTLARSFRRVSNLEASIAPSDLPDFPPAAPIPSNPSTNVSGSNWNNENQVRTMIHEYSVSHDEII